MKPKTIKGFAAGYAVLAAYVIFTGIGAYQALTAHSVSKAEVRRVVHTQLGDENTARQAQQAVADLARNAGVGIVSQKVVKVARHGDDLVYTIKVVALQNEQRFTVKLQVTLHKGLYAVKGIKQVK